MASRTMTYYKSPAGRASYKKKLASDVKRSMTPQGYKKRAELKRKRNLANKMGKNIKSKDYDHGSGKFINSSKNRGKSSGTQGDRNARAKKKK